MELVKPGLSCYLALSGCQEQSALSFRELMNWRSWAGKQARDTLGAQHRALYQRALALNSFIQMFLDECLGAFPVLVDEANHNQPIDMVVTHGLLRTYIQCKATAHQPAEALPLPEREPLTDTLLRRVDLERRRAQQFISHLLRLLAVLTVMRSEEMKLPPHLLWLAAFPPPCIRRCYQPLRLRPSVAANAPNFSSAA